MGAITNILFPVDFSPSCIAMAPYVKRAATLFGARISLIHVFDPASYNGFELYLRNAPEIAEEHQETAKERLHAFCTEEFPASECKRILTQGDTATEIAKVAGTGFDLIIMPSHAGKFRRMLLGSTTAKVLDEADCAVLTSAHTPSITPLRLDRREWVCAIGPDSDGERVLRYAHELADGGRANLQIVHVIQAGRSGSPIRLDADDRVAPEESGQARQRIAELQRKIGSGAPVSIFVGPVKEALVEAARSFEADALIMGRGSKSGSRGRLRDLTYIVARDSPLPVLSV